MSEDEPGSTGPVAPDARVVHESSEPVAAVATGGPEDATDPGASSSGTGP